MNEGFRPRAELAKFPWKEGETFPLTTGTYRVLVEVICYSEGRQTGQFANGSGNYGEYIKIVRPDGTWIRQGINVVPVLPDGRLIMVVEQRPAQWRLPNQPTTIMVEGKELDLTEFGPYSSLEFPGGAVDEEKNFTSAFLGELEEETELEAQEATLYERVPPFSPQGSDIALEMRVGVVYLSRGGFSGYVKSDGGLHVLALTHTDVQANIYAGNIRSGQAALMGWAFYLEVEFARSHLSHRQWLEGNGYMRVRTVRIQKRA